MKTLAEQIQQWEGEKEYIGYEYDQDFIVFSWEGNYYKIPFFVLDDMLNDMIKEKWREPYENPIRKPLSQWLNTWKSTWQPKPIEELKEILKDEMPGLEAYRLYD